MQRAVDMVPMYDYCCRAEGENGTSHAGVNVPRHGRHRQNRDSASTLYGTHTVELTSKMHRSLHAATIKCVAQVAA